MSPSWIWSDKITNERVARVGYNHFISNKGEWNKTPISLSVYIMISDIPQFKLGNICPRDAFRPIARERKYLIDYNIVNRGEWWWNPTKFFVLCFCSLFWPWPCTKHNSCLLRTEDLTNRNVLVTWFMHTVWTQNKRLYMVLQMPSWTFQHKSWHLCLLLWCLPGLPNHSALLTMIIRIDIIML